MTRDGQKKLWLAACSMGALLMIVLLGKLHDVGVNKYLVTLDAIFLLMLAISSKNKMLIVSAVFCSTYFLFLLPYYYLNVSYATRTQYQEVEAETINIFYISVFVVSFFSLWHAFGPDRLNFSSRIGRTHNPLIYYVCLSIIGAFALLTIDPSGTILTKSYREITEERYGFIDYSLIFAMMAFIFGNKSEKDRLLLGVCIAYIAINLLYGLRLRSIQMALLMFILYFEDKFSPKQTVAISLLGLFGAQLLGQLRVGGGSFVSILGLNDGIMVSNQGGVFLTANMFIGLVADGFITAEQRVTTFIGNFLAILWSQSALPEAYNLASLTRAFFTIPGGGLISGYMYVWGGVFGLIGWTTFILFVYLKTYAHSASKAFLVYGVLVMVVLPRWFAYSPLHFFKMGLWCVVIYVVFRASHQIMRKS